MGTAKRSCKSGAGNVSSKENDTAGVIEGLLADTERAVGEFAVDYAPTPAALDYRTFTADAAAARRRPTFPELKDESSHLWAEMAIRRDKLPEGDSIVQRIVGQ